jgi:ferredoxin
MADGRRSERIVMRIAISRDLCTGHGRCYGIAAPDWLKPDDEGYVDIGGSEIQVPSGKEAEALEAEAICPETAITTIA